MMATRHAMRLLCALMLAFGAALPAAANCATPDFQQLDTSLADTTSRTGPSATSTLQEIKAAHD